MYVSGWIWRIVHMVQYQVWPALMYAYILGKQKEEDVAHLFALC